MKKNNLESLSQISKNFHFPVGNLDEILTKGIEVILQTLNFDRAAIFLCDKTNRILQPIEIVTVKGVMEGEGEIILDKKREDPFNLIISGEQELITEDAPEYSIYCPLIEGKKIFGLLRADNIFKKQNVTTEQVNGLEDFAEIFSIGLAEHEMYLEFKLQIKKLSVLNRVSAAISSSLQLEKVLELILSSLVSELGFDRAKLYLVDDEKEKLNYFFHKESIFFNLMVGIPIYVKNVKIGLLVVDNILTRQKILAEDIEVLNTFANQAGLAIENARLFGIEKNFSDELKKQIEIVKKELEMAQAELIRSERLSALGEMSAVVAHEIRNPMASIRASAQRISKKISDDDPNKKYMRYIIEESDRLERIVKDILSFSKEFTPQFEPNDINKLMEEVLYSLQPEIETLQVRLIILLEPTVSIVKIDPAMIRRVLLNVIQNALHSVSNRERKELKVTTLQDGTNIIVEISDTGAGIPEENLKKIFEPFFTTKPTGIGLGLSICQRIIEAHKGKIEVESPVTRDGYETTFRILLPI